jgi:hypothetical protein
MRTRVGDDTRSHLARIDIPHLSTLQRNEQATMRSPPNLFGARRHASTFHSCPLRASRIALVVVAPPAQYHPAKISN